MTKTRPRPPAVEVLKDTPIHLMSHAELGPVLLGDLYDAEEMQRELKELLDRRRPSFPHGGMEAVYQDHALEAFAELSEAETVQEENVRFLLAMVDQLKSTDGALLVEVCKLVETSDGIDEQYEIVPVRHVDYARGSRKLGGIFGSINDPEQISFTIEDIIPDRFHYRRSYGKAGVFSHPA